MCLSSGGVAWKVRRVAAVWERTSARGVVSFQQPESLISGL